MKQARELKEITEKVVIALKCKDSKDFELKKDSKKWSNKEIVGHLIDSGQNNIQRFIRAQYEEDPVISYNQNEWVHYNAYQTFSSENIIELFRQVQLQIVHIWNNFSEENLVKTCIVGNQEYTVLFLIDDYLDHLKHHIKQVFQKDFSNFKF
ncbi:hypothetical protein UJ101_00384 [Flavobacteriaceae bacterium UJ101]|nr:hypothetical protein UJ101_00384 [Flavobacteriaceae bacterium UJ101]